MGKKILIAFLMVIVLLATVSAITGSIGSARMILRASPEEVVERSILVRNVNDVPVTINMEATGTLADNIELEDEEFVLAAGNEKKVSFTIFADEIGTTESKINVRFTPEEGNGIGLPSTIIFVASNVPTIDDPDDDDDDDDDEDPDDEDPDDEDPDDEDPDDDDDSDDPDGGDAIMNLGDTISEADPVNKEKKQRQSLEIPAPLLLLFSSTILLGILLTLIFIKSNKPVKKRKRVKEAHAK